MPSATKFATSKQHKFCAANIKKFASAKNIFATFDFSIVLLAAQVNSKIESETVFCGRL